MRPDQRAAKMLSWTSEVLLQAQVPPVAGVPEATPASEQTHEPPPSVIQTLLA